MSKATIGKVKAFINSRPENHMRLTLALGYVSTNTISAWIKKGRMPSNMVGATNAALSKLNTFSKKEI